MGFLSTQVSVPLWLLIAMIAGLAPLLLKIYKLISLRFLSGTKGNISTDSQMKTISKEGNVRKDKRSNEVKILKLLATKGDEGMLLQSIADRLTIDSNSASRALNYLVEKKMIEVLNSMGGNKYYLTNVGKNYCSMKGYVKTAA